MLDVLFAQPLTKCSLVYVLGCNPPLHTPYISSLNHCLLFATHAHAIATCFAVVPRLCHLFLVFLSALYLALYFYLNFAHPSDNSHPCPLKCYFIFLSYGPCLTSVQCTTPHTTAVQSPSYSQ